VRGTLGLWPGRQPEEKACLIGTPARGWPGVASAAGRAPPTRESPTEGELWKSRSASSPSRVSLSWTPTRPRRKSRASWPRRSPRRTARGSSRSPLRRAAGSWCPPARSRSSSSAPIRPVASASATSFDTGTSLNPLVPWVAMTQPECHMTS